MRQRTVQQLYAFGSWSLLMIFFWVVKLVDVESSADLLDCFFCLTVASTLSLCWFQRLRLEMSVIVAQVAAVIVIGVGCILMLHCHFSTLFEVFHWLQRQLVGASSNLLLLAGFLIVAVALPNIFCAVALDKRPLMRT